MPQRRRLCGKGRCSGAMTALDAPSPSLRSAVQSPDRLACASPLINQRDCEGLGCCYNPSDRMNLYYYGNTAMAGDQGVCHQLILIDRDVRTWSQGSVTSDSTFSANPQQQLQWPILVDRCLYTDNYRTQLVPVGTASGLQFPSHHQRFVVSNFTFVESAFQRVLTGPVWVRFLQFCHEAKSCSGVPALHHFHVLAL
ncbi:unnamed protein product [Natator depressus]